MLRKIICFTVTIKIWVNHNHCKLLSRCQWSWKIKFISRETSYCGSYHYKFSLKYSFIGLLKDIITLRLETDTSTFRTTSWNKFILKDKQAYKNLKNLCWWKKFEYFSKENALKRYSCCLATLTTVSVNFFSVNLVNINLMSNCGELYFLILRRTSN